MLDGMQPLDPKTSVSTEGEPWIADVEEVDWCGKLIGGRYIVMEWLAGGGMSDVYLARDERLQQDVAMKMLKPSMASREMKARMLQEARAAAAIDHPHSLRVLDVGWECGTAYLVMELLRGMSLADYLQDHGGRLPWRVVIPLILPVLDALHHAHQIGYVHRDIKPENLWVTDKSGAPCLILLDLGIAKATRARRRVGGPPTTEPGRALGTPQYMSPEQAAGLMVDARSDVYSMGITICRLLIGQLPDVEGLRAGKVSPLKQALHSPELDLPPPLVGALIRALAQRPEERLSSMRALGQLVRATYDRIHRPRASLGSIVLSLLVLMAALVVMYNAPKLGDRELVSEAVRLHLEDEFVQAGFLSWVPVIPLLPEAKGKRMTAPSGADPAVSVELRAARAETTPPRRSFQPVLARTKAGLQQCFREFGGSEPREFQVEVQKSADDSAPSANVTPVDFMLAPCVQKVLVKESAGLPRGIYRGKLLLNSKEVACI